MRGPKWLWTSHKINGGQLAVPYEPWRSVLAAGSTVGSPASEAVYATNWSAFPTKALRYRKDPWGYVHLIGSVQKSVAVAANFELMLTLPVGYRPINIGAIADGVTFAVPCANAAAALESRWVNVQTDGTVNIESSAGSAAAQNRVFLDPITFLAEDNDNVNLV